MLLLLLFGCVCRLTPNAFRNKGMTMQAPIAAMKGRTDMIDTIHAAAAAVWLCVQANAECVPQRGHDHAGSHCRHEGAELGRQR
jgi:hypothetical protein